MYNYNLYNLHILTGSIHNDLTEAVRSN